MKNLLVALMLSMSLGVAFACPEAKPSAAVEEKKEPETKRVCIKVLDNKTNKEVEKCRVMKIHEKHEGTKVPAK